MGVRIPPGGSPRVEGIPMLKVSDTVYKNNDVEDFSYDSWLKGQLSERTGEYYFQRSRLKYNRHNPTGINHRNTDFTVYKKDGTYHVEFKNPHARVGTGWLIEKVVPKFLDVDPQRKGKWVLVIPRVNEAARRWLKAIDVILIETGQQLVFPSQYERYSPEKRHYATTSPSIWLQKLSSFFKPKKNKGSMGLPLINTPSINTPLTSTVLPLANTGLPLIFERSSLTFGRSSRSLRSTLVFYTRPPSLPLLDWIAITDVIIRDWGILD
jgi:hypothetical protein